MLTALLPLAACLAASAAPAAPPAAAVEAPATDDAPALAARAFADAERVVAVHAIPGAVVFDLDRAGDLYQLTVSLDDDGAVTATALDRSGPTGAAGGVAPGAAARLGRIDRIDTSDDGAAVVLRDGATSATFRIGEGC